MRLFTCPACGTTAYFGNLTCTCGETLVFDPSAGEGMGDGAFVQGLPFCDHRDTLGCNWTAVEDGWCLSCALTAVTPDPKAPEAHDDWAEAERAKRWVIANLGRWGWMTAADPGPQPEFRMLAEETRHGPAKVIMGHAEGVITINLAEADPAERMRRREDLDERFRTMTGHYRHELAHYLFERLLASRAGFPEDFRAMFGDEREDYGEALKRHYENGPAPDWQTRCLTPYAAAHPHEDWAETVAHLLHLTDIADSFAAAGLSSPDIPAGHDAYRETDAGALVTAGASLGLALNHVNRGMGLSDLYPFVIPPPAREKLIFAHAALTAGPPEG